MPLLLSNVSCTFFIAKIIFVSAFGVCLLFFSARELSPLDPAEVNQLIGPAGLSAGGLKRSIEPEPERNQGPYSKRLLSYH